MADAGMAMEKAALKKLLIRSKKEPVHCAVAQAKEAAFALILLDKIKQPKALSKSLENDFPDGKNYRWGTAFVDVDDNPKLVIFTLNKPAPGMARKLIKSLKGTGFTKARIEFEDGSPPEEHAEAEEDSEVDAPAAPRPHAAEPEDAPPAAAAPPPQPAEPAPQADARPAGDTPAAQADPAQQAALTKQLAGLVQRLPQAHADPARLKAMTAAATASRARLAAGDIAGAGKLIAGLSEALARAADSGAPAKASLAEAPKAWATTVSAISASVDELRDAVRKAFAGRPPALLAEMETHLRQLEKITGQFDTELEDLLRAAAAATDPAARAASITKAKKEVADYIKFAQSERLIAHADRNPFGVKTDLRKTLAAGLSQVTKALS